MIVVMHNCISQRVHCNTCTAFEYLAILQMAQKKGETIDTSWRLAFHVYHFYYKLVIAVKLSFIDGCKCLEILPVFFENKIQKMFLCFVFCHGADVTRILTLTRISYLHRTKNLCRPTLVFSNIYKYSSARKHFHGITIYTMDIVWMYDRQTLQRIKVYI